MSTGFFVVIPSMKMIYVHTHRANSVTRKCHNNLPIIVLGVFQWLCDDITLGDNVQMTHRHAGIEPAHSEDQWDGQ